MGILEHRPPPYDWSKIRRRRKSKPWVTAMALAGFGMIAASAYYQGLHLSAAGVLLFLIAALNLWIYQLSSCPRCREPFFYKTSGRFLPYKENTPKCLHCGLQLWSQTGQEPTSESTN